MKLYVLAYGGDLADVANGLNDTCKHALILAEKRLLYLNKITPIFYYFKLGFYAQYHFDALEALSNAASRVFIFYRVIFCDLKHDNLCHIFNTGIR